MQCKVDRVIRESAGVAKGRKLMVLRMRVAVPVLLAVGLAGCAVGPDFQRPAAPAATGFLAAGRDDAAGRGTGLQLAHGGEVPAQWWALFRAPSLDRLVRDGVAHNADLAAAEAAVRLARANALAQRGALLPTVDLGLDASRQKVPVAFDPEAPEAGPAARYGVVTRQVSVAFVPDVWGGLRRQVEASDAEVEAQAFQREGVYLTLAANIALAAIEEARLRGQLAATRRIVALQQDLLRMLQRQHVQGQIARAEVLAQETALAQVQLALPPLERELAQQRHLLAVLTGRLPSDPGLPRFELAAFGLPRQLPLSLPGDVVRQRPDIRTAEAGLRAANAEIGVAIANRLPQITLSANAGKTWSNVPDLSPSGAFWAVGGNLAQKVFDAGALAYKQRAAEEAAQQALAQYRGVVLTAFQNVADMLVALQADLRTIAAARRAKQAAEQTVGLMRRQLEQGEINLALLIEAQRAYLETSTALVDAEAARLADTVALFQALGGGWWNRNDGEGRLAETQL